MPVLVQAPASVFRSSANSLATHRPARPNATLTWMRTRCVELQTKLLVTLRPRWGNPWANSKVLPQGESASAVDTLHYRRMLIVATTPIGCEGDVMARLA